MQLINIQKDVPDLVQSQVLDGTVFTLHVTWNMRGGWYLALHDANDEVIFHARRIVLGFDLLTCVRHDPRCPLGQLVALDMTEREIEPGYADLVAGPDETDLQGRVALLYITQAEVLAGV